MAPKDSSLRNGWRGTGSTAAEKPSVLLPKNVNGLTASVRGSTT